LHSGMGNCPIKPIQLGQCEQWRIVESSGEWRRWAWRSRGISKNRRSSPAASGRQHRVRGTSGGAGWLSCRRDAVVEHKAQTHNGGFALVSRHFRASYLDARVYFSGGHVRHRPARPSRGKKGSHRLRKPHFGAAAGR